MHHFDNDMDELFRRAADKYPLKEEDSHWEEIAGRLGSSIPRPQGSKTNARRRFALWLILLLMLGSGTTYWLLRNGGDTHRNPVEQAKTGSAERAQALPKKAGSEILPDLASQVRVPVLTNDMPNRGVELSGKFPGAGLLVVPGSETTLAANNQYLTGSNTDFDGPDYRHDLTRPISFREFLSGDLASRHGPLLRDLDKLPAQPDLLTQPAFYLGMVAGPDFSRVKSQSVKQAGYSLGLLAGYRFARRWSLEAGLLIEKKRYYSSGEHFKMDKIGPSMPAGMKIMEVESQTQVLQIPVNLKYDFGRAGANHFYALAGISSYVVLNEKNNYNVEWNGTADNMKGSYQQNSLRLPASVNLGAGFEWKLGSQSGLRIQPYLEIPLKGMGVGSLPVTSSGLQIGFTKSF